MVRPASAASCAAAGRLGGCRCSLPEPGPALPKLSTKAPPHPAPLSLGPLSKSTGALGDQQGPTCPVNTFLASQPRTWGRGPELPAARLLALEEPDVQRLWL